METDWSISPGIHSWLYENVYDGSNILELGSGAGSAELAKHYNIYSVEHDELWLNKYENVNYLHVPLKQHKPVKGFDHFTWYDSTILKEKIKSIQYDYLIIDGPPGCFGRSGIIKYLDIFNTDVTILIDDIQRMNEYLITRAISKKIKREFRVVDCWKEKSWAVFERSK